MTAKVRFRNCAATVLLSLGVQAAWAQLETVVVKRPAELREAPGEASRSLGALPVQTPVTRLAERQGAWVAVRTAQGVNGWLHMFDIGAQGGAQSGGNATTGALRGITSFFTKGSAQPIGNSTATATIGIRGLGAEDIANARPNLLAVQLVEGMRQDAGQAQRFASTAALMPQVVPALPVPAAPLGSARATTGQSAGAGRGPQEPLN